MASPRGFFVFEALSLIEVVWLVSALARPARADDNVTTIDDQDHRISYGGMWQSSTSDLFYNGTRTGTNAAGATASFTFNGTGISVFGALCPAPGVNTNISTYTIDSGTPYTFTPPAGAPCQYRVPFWSSTPLSNLQHTLIINVPNPNTWYWLDYLEVTAPVSVSSAAPTTTAEASMAPTPSQSTSAESSSSGSQEITPGAIAGIVLGAVVLIVLVGLGAFWWKRKRQRSYPPIVEAGVLSAEIEAVGRFTPYHLVAASSATQFGSTGVSKPTLISNSYDSQQGNSMVTTSPTVITGTMPPSSHTRSSQGNISQMISPTQSQSMEATIFPLQNNRQSISTNVPPAYEE